MKPEHEDHSPWVTMMTWSSRVTTVALEMALPPLAGYGLDQWLGILPVCLILGAILGFVLGMMELLRMAKPNDSDRP